MKKRNLITLLLLLFEFGMQAQNFQAECYSGVEKSENLLMCPVFDYSSGLGYSVPEYESEFNNYPAFLPEKNGQKKKRFFQKYFPHSFVGYK